MVVGFTAGVNDVGVGLRGGRLGRFAGFERVGLDPPGTVGGMFGRLIGFERVIPEGGAPRGFTPWKVNVFRVCGPPPNVIFARSKLLLAPVPVIGRSAAPGGPLPVRQFEAL